MISVTMILMIVMMMKTIIILFSIVTHSSQVDYQNGADGDDHCHGGEDETNQKTMKISTFVFRCWSKVDYSISLPLEEKPPDEPPGGVVGSISQRIHQTIFTPSPPLRKEPLPPLKRAPTNGRESSEPQKG